MDKDIIKRHLHEKVSGAKPKGLTSTEDVQKDEKKVNKDYYDEVGGKMKDYDKSSKTDDNETEPVKYNYNGKSEEDYHNEIEIMNGQEMIQYDRAPNKQFVDRAKKAIEGHPTMGNSPEYANVVQDSVWGGNKDFGKNLVKRVEDSAKKRDASTPAILSFGDDIEIMDKKIPARKVAVQDNVNNANKNTIKESKMKRLKFKTPFDGVGNALNIIPEGYRVDGKIFEMTDGNENYRIRWEGSLSEGKGVVLMASDNNMVNEDINKMKHLMGYKSQDTLGITKGQSRLDENIKFNELVAKIKSSKAEESQETAE